MITDSLELVLKTMIINNQWEQAVFFHNRFIEHILEENDFVNTIEEFLQIIVLGDSCLFFSFVQIFF